MESDFPIFSGKKYWLLCSYRETDISDYCMTTSTEITLKGQCPRMTVDGGLRVKLFPPHIMNEVPFSVEKVPPFRVRNIARAIIPVLNL